MPTQYFLVISPNWVLRVGYRMEEQGIAAEGLSACQCVHRADHDRIKSQVEKQRRRAEQAERAAEPLRHSIRQLSAEVEAKAEEIRVVCHFALPGSTSPCEVLLQGPHMKVCTT